MLKVASKFGLNQSSDVFRPRLPLLFKICLEQPKGCKFFYNVLTNSTTTRLTSRHENKWHEKLKTIYTTVVWDKIYTLPTKFLVPNKQIWTQIQINKYLLPTNYTVSFYDRKVPSLCSFCNLHPEHLHFLIWDCKVVQMFWVIINSFILNFCPRFCLGAKEAIFGDTNFRGGFVC